MQLCKEYDPIVPSSVLPFANNELTANHLGKIITKNKSLIPIHFCLIFFTKSKGNSHQVVGITKCSRVVKSLPSRF